MKVELFDGFNNVVLRTGDDPTGVGRLVVVFLRRVQRPCEVFV